MANGITHFQTEEGFKNINEEDIDDRLVGSFPSNHMNKFIDHVSMISQNKGKYPFVVANRQLQRKWSALAECT